MFGKKPVTPQVEAAVARAVNYEVTVADMARRSERRAWRVAWSAIVMSLILAGGYFYFLPLKEKVPYLVMADAYTGTSTVARLTGEFDNQSISTSEALNKSNLVHFIMARESYDYSQIGDRNWNIVHAMATDKVAPAYANLYKNDNPAGPVRMFGRNKAVRVRILSIQLQGAQGTGKRAKTAVVRFQRSVYTKDSGVVLPLDSKIATVEYRYNPDLEMDEFTRVLNPLGFQVTDYRVDNDYAEAPAVEGEFPVQPRVAAPNVPAVDPAAPAQASPVQANSAPANPVQAMAPAETTVPAATGGANGVNPR
ncbi:VirB8 family type IV secretion system protein [Lysobacter fragariae]